MDTQYLPLTGYAIQRRCTCEDCCFARDEEDDRSIGLEYKASQAVGEPILKSLSLGDKVEYYDLPEEYKLDGLLKRYDNCAKRARHVFQTTITQVEKTYVLTDADHKIRAAECGAWGLHKI